MSKQIILTKEISQRLDRLVRTKAGRILVPYDLNELTKRAPHMSTLIGYCSDWPISVFVNGIPGAVPCICVADSLDLDGFRMPGGSVVLDTSQLPEDKIHDYIVHHEIAHAVGCHNKIIAYYKAQCKDRKFMNALKYSLEMEAERYGWQMIMPGRPLPLCVGSRYNVKQIMKSFDKFLNTHKSEIKAQQTKAAPIPLDMLIELREPVGLCRKSRRCPPYGLQSPQNFNLAPREYPEIFTVT